MRATWQRKVVVALGAILALVATVSAVVLVVNGPSAQKLGTWLAGGVLSSLIGAALFALYGIVWAATGRQAPPGAPGGEAPSGINGAVQKCTLGSEDWMAILTGARHEFYIVGHSLGRWCSDTNRSAFTTNVRRILGAGGEVTLVMLDAESPSVDQLLHDTQRDYSQGIRESVAVLRELTEDLPQAQRARLRISPLGGRMVIPYMVVGNEERLMTATYLARTDSEEMICLDLRRDSEPGIAIYDDLKRLAEDGRGSEPLAPTRAPQTPASGQLRRRLRRPRGG